MFIFALLKDIYAMSKFELQAPFEIIDTGTFIQYMPNEAVIVIVTENDGTPIKAKFNFVYESNLGEPKIEVKQDDKDKDAFLLTIKHSGAVSNFGFLKPIQVGSFNGKILFFNFRADLNGIEDSALIHYSWYTGKEITK